MVAKGLNYRFYDKSGSLISLKGAATSGKFTASLSADSDVQSTTDATLKASAPRVVGLRLFPVDVFRTQQLCEQAILFKATGTASVSIVGGGGKGNIGPMQTLSKPIGQTAELASTGGESSECDSSFERKISGAMAKARVESAGDRNLKFIYDISASGGHYVTAAMCTLGRVIGKTGHDTSATAAADLRGTISAIVRSEDSPALRVSWTKMPLKGATVTVLDWNNEPLKDAKGVSIVGPINAVDSGGMDYQTHGPGLYRVETTIQLNSSVAGNVDEAKHEMAEITVEVF